MLGLVDNASLSTPQDPQFRQVAWALYIQDTWKITPRLTLDYGLRWDYQTALSELWNRFANFSPSTPNPSAGGRLGATIYDGYGPGRCNCSFTKNYPYAMGPRLGVAYQFAPKMVLRAGWGITYEQDAQYNYISNNPIVGVGFNQLTWFPTSYGVPAVTLDQGLQYTQAQLYAISLDPGIRPSPGQINSPSYWLDSQGGRPGRVMQWSVGLQREISKDLMVEAAYVGNRGVWEQADSLIDLNGNTPQHLSSLGLNITNASARSLLTSTMNSPQVIAAGFNLPYAGFPSTLTLAQALRPFPQFGTIPILWAPVGNSWYDSLQAKVTKRYGRGLTAQGAFTWQKELEIGADSQSGGAVAINDVYNRQNNRYVSPSSLPFILAFNVAYQLPRWGSNRWMRRAVGDWTVGFLARYQSGLPILVPYSNNSLNAILMRSANSGSYATFDDRVPGQPLFLKNLNCRCFDATRTLVLNPAAWTDPGSGNWGTAAPYYNDYRFERRPEENVNFGRVFRLRENVNLTVRAEFYNAFNRTYLNNPASTNAAATPVVSSSGVVTSGFGFINTGTTFSPPRTGQIVMRLVW
jgi:outer membrane receptor protein involved in Fe transport